MADSRGTGGEGRGRLRATVAWACGVALTATACAAPVQRLAVPLPAAPPHPRAAVERPAAARPLVGVAFGGGSARGIAHVGVIRWFQEHRIPIDLAAGTSMGGLVGGAFATGMDADELDTLIATMDWDELFGSSSFAFKNIRRKSDARAYPSYLEFGLKRGLTAPVALNTGEYVELMLARLTAPYHGIAAFDELPTPFRAVAMDLVTASQVVLDRGSLADAMRATMSLPLIFPPVEVDGRVLVDGGTMNNVPADVVRRMGAGRVIAVNVGDLSDRESLSYSLIGLADATLGAMMRAATRATIATADIVIDVPLSGYGSLDWRRSAALIEEGYRAAEARRDQLLPLALGEAEYARWREARQARRRTEIAVPAFARSEGFVPADARRLEALLAPHVGRPVDFDLLNADIAELTGLDRYQTVTWRLERDGTGATGLVVRGRAKSHAPPFMMLGLNLENTTSSDFRITTTARYLRFDVAGSGSELRVDGTVGSNPAVGAELYRPLGGSALFVGANAGVHTATFDFTDDGAVVARYGVTTTRAGAIAGVNIGAVSDLRATIWGGRTSSFVRVGDPGLPGLSGSEAGLDLVWRLDTQDSPVVPSRGSYVSASLHRVFNGPDIAVGDTRLPGTNSLTQAAARTSTFWTLGERGRLFAYTAFGSTFEGDPLITNEFALGQPLRLAAYRARELRGAHQYVVTAGYLRQAARLPDFLGGPVFVGAWLENGDAFDEWRSATIRTNVSGGVVMDTIAGPVLIAVSSGFDGRWRTFLGVGRIFR